MPTEMELLAIAVDCLDTAVQALDNIASWSEGDTVTRGFDEPCAAQNARAALAHIEVKIQELKNFFAKD